MTDDFKFDVSFADLVAMDRVNLRPTIERLRRVAIRNMCAVDVSWHSAAGENRLEVIVATSARTLLHFSAVVPVGRPVGLLELVSMVIRAAADESIPRRQSMA